MYLVISKYLKRTHIFESLSGYPVISRSWIVYCSVCGSDSPSRWFVIYYCELSLSRGPLSGSLKRLQVQKQHSWSPCYWCGTATQDPTVQLSFLARATLRICQRCHLQTSMSPPTHRETTNTTGGPFAGHWCLSWQMLLSVNEDIHVSHFLLPPASAFDQSTLSSVNIPYWQGAEREVPLNGENPHSYHLGVGGAEQGYWVTLNI